MRLVLVLAFAACGCGGCGNHAAAQHDASVADVGDAGVPDGEPVGCSIPAVNGVPPATHRDVVSYNYFVAGYDPDYMPGDQPIAVFLDQAGVALVGAEYFRRFDLDGIQVSQSRVPPLATGSRAIDQYSPVQYPGGYAVITADPSLGAPPDCRLCRLTDGTWPDPSTCTPLDTDCSRWVPVLRWHGDAFRVHTATGVASYAADGSFSANHPFDGTSPTEGPLAVEYVGDHAVMHWYTRSDSDTGCDSSRLWLVPDSYDLASGQKYNLTPEDFRYGSPGNPPPSMTTGSYAALETAGDCLKSTASGECSPRSPLWRAAFLTVVGPDAQPLVLRQPLPIHTGDDQLIWDGENIVLVHPVGSFLTLVVIDLQGTVVRVGRVGLDLSANKDMNRAKIVAVAPNDYILAYSVYVSVEAWIARFQLVPL